MSIANTTIRIRKSVVSGVSPSSLANGEIAINSADGKLFYSTPSGSISFINNQQSFATINANGSLILAGSSTDILSIIPGTNITISACTVSKSITINSTATGGGGASDKAFIFRQNTAPSTSNTSDLWLNYDTGVMYENFGNTSSPVWAEFGPSGQLSNTQPGIVTGSSVISTNGLYSTNNFTGSYTDGIVVDYVNGNGRISVGTNDGLTFYNGGVAVNSLLNISSSGNVLVNSTVTGNAFVIIAEPYTPVGKQTWTFATQTGIGPPNPSYMKWPDGTFQYTAFDGTAVDQSARNTANSAWNKANNALANATGIFAGDLTITGNTSIGKQLFINYTPPVGVNSAIEITSANTKGGAGYADFLKVTNTSGGTTNPNKFFRINQTGGFEIIDNAYLNNILSLTDGGDVTIRGNTTFNGIAPGYAPNRPAFRVYGANTTNALTTTQNGSGVLNYNNWAVDYNQGSYLNNTTGIFTAPVAGLYQVNVVARNSGYAGGISQICALKNSSIVIMVEWAASSTMNHTGGSTTVKLAVGDTLKLQVTGGQVTFDGNDNWSVAYIG